MSMLEGDPIVNVLHIDLTKRRFWVEKREDLFEKYIGGIGVATQLLHEECPRGADPLSGENPIIFAVGPLTGYFPLASKTVAVFKSPHTGNLGESHAGGRSAVAIRMAGYGAIVIKGASDFPVYVAIHGARVFFRDARALWGMNSIIAGRVIREAESGAGVRTIMRIGPAGERLVSYANVTTETYRCFGRLGLGAVFGSKNLKAVVVSGRRGLPKPEIREYRRVYRHIYDKATTSDAMKKYHDLGTAQNVLPLTELGALPSLNLREARPEKAEEISGEHLASYYLGRRIACSHCPVACIHIAALREPYEDVPYFYKTSMIAYDYEPIYALGAMLGLKNAADLLRLKDRVDALGIDAMSVGVVLAWATEALERGLISERDTDGIILKWGDWLAYADAVMKIVTQHNEFYAALARGVEHASSIYGGEDFALSLSGNEMPGYHTGYGCHIGALIGARHGHLDNAGYSVDQKVKKVLPPEELIDRLIEEERWRQILSSLVICFFSREIYKRDVVIDALKCVGINMTEKDLERIGTEIHRSKYAFKLREGFSFEKLRIPRRIYETSSPLGMLKEEYFRDALAYFQQKMKELLDYQSSQKNNADRMR